MVELLQRARQGDECRIQSIRECCLPRWKDSDCVGFGTPCTHHTPPQGCQTLTRVVGIGESREGLPKRMSVAIGASLASLRHPTNPLLVPRCCLSQQQPGVAIASIVQTLSMFCTLIGALLRHAGVADVLAGPEWSRQLLHVPAISDAWLSSCVQLFVQGPPLPCESGGSGTARRRRDDALSMLRERQMTWSADHRRFFVRLELRSKGTRA